MHVMGGFGVASLVLAVASYRHKKVTLLVLLALYALVAFGWEFYELAGDILTQSELNGWSDTISDFINGGIGATLAYYLLKK